MDAHSRPAHLSGEGDAPVASRGGLISNGRLFCPLWGVLGAWAALCGALSSNHLRWAGPDLLTLAIVLLLVILAWDSLWDTITGATREGDRYRSLAEGGPAARLPRLLSLPYTQPSSPAGRLFHYLSRLVGWWREDFWPVAGASVWKGLVATALTVVLALLLPARLYPLYGVLGVLLAMGAIGRKRGSTPLFGQAFLQVGLAWLAGHMVFAELTWASSILAVSFAACTWGILYVAEGRTAGLWLVNGGQAIVTVLLLVLRQPLAGGATALLLFGQAALQPSLRSGGNSGRMIRYALPWLAAAMLVAALALP